MMQGISLCDHVTERDINHQLPITNLNSSPHRVPKSKPRLCLFTFGKAEVRVAFNDRAERYHSRNLVTERDSSLSFQTMKNAHNALDVL